MRQSAALFVTIAAVCAVLLALAALVADLLLPATTDRHAPLVLISVPPGASARQIGDILAAKGLVRKPESFVVAARIDGLSGKMKAGRYELSPAMPPRQMALLLAEGLTANDVLTIPEGFTVSQIARRVGAQRLGNEAAFLALARAQGRTFHVGNWTPPAANLEGYLFPDTYRVPRGTTERDLVSLLLADWVKRVGPVRLREMSRFPGGAADAVNLASLVEREAETEADRPLIASVLLNRLQKNMRLQCDATVQYALPEHKTRVMYADLKVVSAYNTYLHAGLPPTPICSPGLPSLDAVLHPARTDYLFYVGRPGGSHIFTRTLAEHERAIASVRSGKTIQ